VIPAWAVYVGSGVAGLSFLLAAIAYLGDSRWRRKTDDVIHRLELARTLKGHDDRFAGHEQDLALTKQRLAAGDQTMSRMEGMLTANSGLLGSISIQVAEIRGRFSSQSTKEGKS
jgi:hypothetical protein